MGARGRKTRGDKTAAARVVEEMGLPKPPSYLGADAQQEWCEIVSTYPADRFPRSTHPMLEAYCYQACLQRSLQVRLAEMQDDKKVKFSEIAAVMRAIDTAQSKMMSAGVRLGIARTSLSGRHNNDPDDIRDNDPAPWAKKT